MAAEPPEDRPGPDGPISEPPSPVAARPRLVRPRPRVPGRVAVGFLSPSLYAGGAERWVLELMRRLDRERYSLTGLVLFEESLGTPEMVAEAEAMAPILHAHEGLRRLDAASDVLIVWGVHNVPALIGASHRSKIVIVSHTSGDSPWAQGAVSGWERASGLVAVSEVAVQPFPAAARPRVTVIPNGVDPKRAGATVSRAAMRARWGVPADAKVLGCLNRISQEKQPKLLADALAFLPSDWIGVHVGRGLEPYRSEVLAHADQVAPGRLVYPGFEADVGSAFGAFDAYLLSSTFEGSSLSLLECWASGTPALATPVGIADAHLDLIRPLSLACDGREIADAVLADLADPLGTARRADRARATVLERYTADQWAASWGDYLACLVPPRRARTGKPRVALGVDQKALRGG